MLTTTQIHDLVEAYAAGPRLIESAVAGISGEELHFKPGPEHWSIHENVVHLADTDLVGAVRMRFILAEPGASLVAFDQTRWAQALGYTASSLAGSLSLFRAIREATADVLRRAPTAAWEQTGTHTESGPQTLAWMVEHFADHVHYHLRTIAKRRRQYTEAQQGLDPGRSV
jgi:hypothetical protein